MILNGALVILGAVYYLVATLTCAYNLLRIPSWMLGFTLTPLLPVFSMTTMMHLRTDTSVPLPTSSLMLVIFAFAIMLAYLVVFFWRRTLLKPYTRLYKRVWLPGMVIIGTVLVNYIIACSLYLFMRT